MEIENAQSFTSEMKLLEAKGFTQERRNLKLLTKTKGNVEVVANFLTAQKALRELLIADRRSNKEAKATLEGLEVTSFNSKNQLFLQKLNFRENKKSFRKPERKVAKEDRSLNKEAKKEQRRLAQEDRLAKRQEHKVINNSLKSNILLQMERTEDVPLKALPEKIKVVYLGNSDISLFSNF
jgi:hypothetical protein